MRCSVSLPVCSVPPNVTANMKQRWSNVLQDGVDQKCLEEESSKGTATEIKHNIKVKHVAAITGFLHVSSHSKKKKKNLSLEKDHMHLASFLRTDFLPLYCHNFHYVQFSVNLSCLPAVPCAPPGTSCSKK